MIAIDTSVLIAILTEEPEADAFRAALLPSSATWITAVSLVEATMVASRDETIDPVAAINKVVASLEIEVIAVDRAMAELARQAFLTFGKGRGHAASLNFGDCFSYALAKALDAPLLFKGGDFARTDVKVAVPPP